MDTTTKECVRTAWQDLHQAVRAATLYSSGHARVRELVAGHWRVLADTLLEGARVTIEFEKDGASVGGDLLSSFVDGPDNLAALLYGEGIRRLQFGPTYELPSATRLVDTIRPYFHTKSPPEQALSDKLHWEPIEGLTLTIAEQVDRSGVEFDPMTHGENAWHALLLEDDPGQLEPLPLEALRSSWDCTGGSIPWPAPVDPDDLAELDAEVDTADTSGAPMSRVGIILADVAELWIADERLERVFAMLPDQVDSLLARHHPGEAARLLAPLRRWGDALGQSAREARAKTLFRALQVRLLEDRLLARLMESILARAVEPSKAASYFAGSGPSGPARVLEFAAATPDGPYREAMVRVATNDLGEQADRLEPILAKAPVGPALVAFDVLNSLPASTPGMHMALDALNRPEPALRQRATSYLMRYDDDAVGDRMMELLLGPKEVRSLALVYFTRHPRVGVFECLRAISTNARFDALPMEARVELTRAMGFVAPHRATDLALAVLGPQWETGDLNQAAPWVTCLAAAGAPEAYKAIVTLDRRSDHTLLEVVAAASLTWQRRYTAERTDSAAPASSGPDLSSMPAPGGHQRTAVPGSRRLQAKRRGTDVPSGPVRRALDPVVLTEALLEDSSLEFHIADVEWNMDAIQDTVYKTDPESGEWPK